MTWPQEQMYVNLSVFLDSFFLSLQEGSPNEITVSFLTRVKMPSARAQASEHARTNAETFFSCIYARTLAHALAEAHTHQRTQTHSHTRTQTRTWACALA